MKILFVCTGNTCRSPMAEGYFNSLKLEGYTAESAGLSVPFPDCANPDAVDTVKDFGIDLYHHRSRQITKELCDSADRIVCMTSSHGEALVLAGIDKEKIIVPKNDVLDPFCGGRAVYERCFGEIRAFIKNILPDLGVYSLTDFKDQDAADIVALEKECFCEPWSEKSVLSSAENGTHFVLCKCGGKTIGYGGVSIVAGEAYITNIAVRNKFRRLGIGRALTERLIEIADGCDFISLEVRESNIPAVSLYSECGFEVVGKRKNFYRSPSEDAIIMTKTFKGKEI